MFTHIDTQGCLPTQCDWRKDTVFLEQITWDEVFARYGVGSWTAKDFPSPLLRFLQCLGIDPRVCPPQQPEKNPFVERYHKNFKYECQLIEQPQDLAQTCEVNQPYVHFYNYERPNQAITCGNQPPLIKFSNPPALSPLPQTADPDRWLLQQTGKTYTRRLGRDGCFQ